MTQKERGQWRCTLSNEGLTCAIIRQIYMKVYSARHFQSAGHQRLILQQKPCTLNVLVLCAWHLLLWEKGQRNSIYFDLSQYTAQHFSQVIVVCILLCPSFTCLHRPTSKAVLVYSIQFYYSFAYSCIREVVCYFSLCVTFCIKLWLFHRPEPCLRQDLCNTTLLHWQKLNITWTLKMLFWSKYKEFQCTTD